MVAIDKCKYMEMMHEWIGCCSDGGEDEYENRARLDD